MKIEEHAVKLRIRALVEELSPIRPARIRDDTLLVADLGYDSLRLIELVVALEDEFDLVTEGEDVPEIATVSELESHVVGLLPMAPAVDGAA